MTGEELEEGADGEVHAEVLAWIGVVARLVFLSVYGLGLGLGIRGFKVVSQYDA